MTVGDANDNTDDPYENGKYTITGSSTVTVSQMVSYYQSRTFYPSFYGDRMLQRSRNSVRSTSMNVKRKISGQR